MCVCVYEVEMTVYGQYDGRHLSEFSTMRRHSRTHPHTRMMGGRHECPYGSFAYQPSVNVAFKKRNSKIQIFPCFSLRHSLCLKSYPMVQLVLVHSESTTIFFSLTKCSLFIIDMVFVWRQKPSLDYRFVLSSLLSIVCIHHVSITPFYVCTVTLHTGSISLSIHDSGETDWL